MRAYGCTCVPQLHLSQRGRIDVSAAYVAQVSQSGDDRVDGIQLVLGAWPGLPTGVVALGALPQQVGLSHVSDVTSGAAARINCRANVRNPIGSSVSPFGGHISA
jgi:hypothetical protein